MYWLIIIGLFAAAIIFHIAAIRKYHNVTLKKDPNAKLATVAIYGVYIFAAIFSVLLWLWNTGRMA